MSALTCGDRTLASAGYRLLRMAEEEVLSALPQVVARIRAAIEEVGLWPVEARRNRHGR